MISDLLSPCDGVNCDEIGDIRCNVCRKWYCEDHIDAHECLDEED